MGELITRADSLEREITLIAREIEVQKKAVEGLAGKIKYIAQKAEETEKENELLKKQLEAQKKS